MRGQTLGAREAQMRCAPFRQEGFAMFMLSNAYDSWQRSLDTIRANPIPVALIGLGTAWLISNNTGMTDRVADTASDMGRRAGELATGAAQKVGLAGSDNRALGHTGHPMVDRDGENSEGWVHQVTDQASGALRSARDSSGALLNRVGGYAGAEGVSDMFERSPLIIGAIGVLTGAIIAALLPITDVENELLGETRDELWARAEDFGGEAVQRVREAATEAAARAVDVVTGVAVESVRQLGENSTESRS